MRRSCSDPFNEACDPYARKIADLHWGGLITDDEELEFSDRFPLDEHA